MRKMRIVVFTLVLGIAAYAVVRGLAKDKAGLSCGAAGGSSFSEALRGGEDKTTVSCGSEVGSLIALDKAAGESSFIFLLLPGEEKSLNENAAKRTGRAAKELTTKDRRIMTFTMNPESADFARLVKDFRVAELPGVVIAGKGCGAEAVSGEITKDSLLAAFVKVTKKRSACCPGARK